MPHSTRHVPPCTARAYLDQVRAEIDDDDRRGVTGGSDEDDEEGDDEGDGEGHDRLSKRLKQDAAEV